jgi:cellulose synthase/poly-beta-1,6-N-acetylglucosamine synthase-like glycosyltransferase
MFLVLSVSVLVLGYVYIGYPLLLRAAVRLRGPRPILQRDSTPSLSFIISAHNESAVIRRKLENTLALDYPRHALQIVVVSDASDDGTDEIVCEFASRGVELARQHTRRGKTAGLNSVVPSLTGEIVVFSDANAMYERSALLKLARNFADPAVGCVTGEARYVAGRQSAADVGERAYWDYEIQIKRLETALGSMVGGDGAIYAIRRSLWRTLPDNAINDFLNPLQIVAAGYRAIYEPAAICYEETSGGVKSEYRRRVRIVSRSWRAVFQAPGVLNPFRVGLFTWSLVSHKMLRWLSGVFGLLAVGAAIVLVTAEMRRAPAMTLVTLAGATVALMATRLGRHIVALLAYFATIYVASAVGVAKGTFGRVSGVWATPREQPLASPGPVVPVGLMLQIAVVAFTVGAIVVARLTSSHNAARLIFWTSIAVLAYLYVGYPALLGVIRLFGRRSVRRAPIEPRVCVFVAANNEASIIDAKVRNTLSLEYPPDRLEIVVASDGSTDATNEIVRRFAPRVQLLEFKPRRGKIAVINDGIKEIASEIVVFSDANTFLQPDAVRSLVQSFADPQVGAVSGDVVLIGERASFGPSEDLYYRYERWLQRAESEIGSMIGADGALYAIRRELFAPPANDTILDDMAIPMAVIKQGRRVVFEGSARAFEQGSETATEEFARKARVVAGAIQFIGRAASSVPVSSPQVILSLVSHKGLRWLSPAFAASAFGSSLVLADSAFGYALAASAQGGLLLMALLGCVPRLRRLTPLAMAHYFCLLQLAAAVGFVRGVSGRQSVLWRRFERAQVSASGGLLC